MMIIRMRSVLANNHISTIDRYSINLADLRNQSPGFFMSLQVEKDAQALPFIIYSLVNDKGDEVMKPIMN